MASLSYEGTLTKIKPYICPLFSLSKQGKPESLTGTATFVFHSGHYMLVTATHVMNQMPNGYALMSSGEKTGMLEEPVTIYTTPAESEFIDPDISVRIFSKEKAIKLQEGQNFIRLANYDDSKVKKINFALAGYPDCLNNEKGKHKGILPPLINDIELKKHQKHLPVENRDKYMTLVYLNSQKNGSKTQFNGDFNRCSGGAILSLKNGKIRLSGIAIRQDNYKRTQGKIITALKSSALRPVIKQAIDNLVLNE